MSTPDSPLPLNDIDSQLSELKLYIPDDLYRAFHRCLWILVNENNGDRLNIMEEVIHDFLVKHGC